MSATGGSPLIEVRGLSLKFGTDKNAGRGDTTEQVAIDRVSFSIAAGTTLGLVGSSGAGKSSIARAIMRLIAPDSGEILLCGNDILRMGPRELAVARRRIQLVFQDPSASLSPRRTVAQTLLEPLEHFAIGNTAYRKNKIVRILGTVGLGPEALQRYPHQFSSGQQQRIAIARSLVTEPDLLIADEAVSALDVSVQAQILQLLQSLQQSHGIALLFISHDLAVVRQLADDVAVMYRGQLLEHSSADVFFTAPAHPYSRSLLAFANHDAGKQQPRQPLQLETGRSNDSYASTCIYAGVCTDKMPVCERVEPALQWIQRENQHKSDPHCVKCHLYDPG